MSKDEKEKETKKEKTDSHRKEDLYEGYRPVPKPKPKKKKSPITKE